MKKVIFLLLPLFAFMLLACIGGDDSTLDEGGLFDDVDSTMPSESATEVEYVSWGSLGIPEIIPEYTDGVIEKPFFDFNWTTGGVPNSFAVYETSEAAIEEYVENAVNDGWEISWANEVQGDEDDSWALSYEVDGKTYSILLSWYGVSDDYLMIILGESEF